MEEQILVGREADIFVEPAAPFMRALEEAARAPSPRLDFMTAAHHRVRDAAVLGIAKRGRALSPADLSDTTGLDVRAVERLIEELESRLFFLVRNGASEVSWAFPVTSEPTPHRVRFSTGEDTYAA